MMNTRVLLAGALALALAVGACAQGNLPEPVQAAVADLSDRLGIAQDEITVAQMEQLQWPDTSLGNPQPGRMYAQVITPGYRVTLQAGGEQYEYHTDMGTRVVLVGGEEPVGDDESETRLRLQMIAAAKSHLARRLQMAPAEVFLAVEEEVTWPDASLGAAATGAVAQVETPGYRLVFETSRGLHEYQTDLDGRVVSSDGAIVEVADVTGTAPPQGEDVNTEAAVADLAARLSVDADAISVASVEAVSWPNGALGLPEPGMMYTQAIVPGHRVMLNALGRTFEYHLGQGAVRYAGIVYADAAAADVSVLALQHTEPTDGNNFFHLQRVDPETGQSEVAVEFVSSFAATPDGRDLAIVRRGSRSHHDLFHVPVEGDPVRIATAFEFGNAALRPDGRRLAYWSRPSLMDRDPRLNIAAAPWGEAEPRVVELPGLTRGQYTPGPLAWSNDGLAVTVYDADGAHGFFWDGKAMSGLGPAAVLAWIPRTSSFLARVPRQDGAPMLATIIPGSGQTQVLLVGSDVKAAAAPADRQRVLAAVATGTDGVRVLSLSWGGDAEEVRTIEGASDASVAVSASGGIATVSYLRGDEPRSDVLALSAAQPLLTTMQQPGPAVPIVR